VAWAELYFRTEWCVVQMALGSSMKEDSQLTSGRVERAYFERCVAVNCAALKLADNATLLTCSTEPYHPGTSTHRFIIIHVAGYGALEHVPPQLPTI